MASCNVTLETIAPIDTTLDITGKVRDLTAQALGTDSIYMRAKDTFKELFDGKNITSDEYAQLASSFVSQLAVATTQSVIQGALEWAKQEAEIGYSLAAIQANTELTKANVERTRHEICKLDKDTDMLCANIAATWATNIRKNGRVKTWRNNDVTTCVPETLEAEGSEYEQIESLKSKTYIELADSYRKSGIVHLGTDITDTVKKGLTNEDATAYKGYTNAQEQFARRQILSFEDSKRSHAANASSQLIGQLIASEIVPATTYVTQWNAALSYLNKNSVDTDADGYPDTTP